MKILFFSSFPLAFIQLCTSCTMGHSSFCLRSLIIVAQQFKIAHSYKVRKELRKNPALQDSTPAAGRFSDIIPLRRSAFLPGGLYCFIGKFNEISYKTIKLPHLCPAWQFCIFISIPLPFLRLSVHEVRPDRELKAHLRRDIR